MEKIVCNLYGSGRSISDVSKQLNLSKSKVYRILKKNNVNTKRNSSHYIEKLYDYSIDSSFFENIDTEAKAYTLGFLYADGNIHKKHYHIKLKLQERDKYVLDTINKHLKSDKPLYFHKKTKDTHQNQYSLVISNKKMYNDILEQGLYPNKTYSLSFKKTFSDKLMPHFIRGFFDGDGWISVYENTLKYESKKSDKETVYKNFVGEAGFTGSDQMCLFIRDYLYQKLKISSNISKDNRSDSRISNLKITNREGVRKFYNFIYQDSTIHLSRKKEKFETLNYI